VGRPRGPGRPRTFDQLPAGALPIGPDSFVTPRRKQLAELTVGHAISAIYQYCGFVAAGGLMNSGRSLAGASRQAGIYAGWICKGRQAGRPARPAIHQDRADLQSQDREGARAHVPESLLARADEVIE
jgi:hypothetical protein